MGEVAIQSFLCHPHNMIGLTEGCFNSSLKLGTSTNLSANSHDGRYNDTMRRGFTLVEIIVVIVILMILAAILFPVFSRAKENSKQTSCQAQLHQFATGLGMYRSDHDDLGYRHLNKGNRYPWNWYEGLEPYLKDGRLVWCVEPGNWGEPNTEYGFYNWPHQNIAVGGNPFGLYKSWDAPAGRTVVMCKNHARGPNLDPYGMREGKVLYAREDTSVSKVDAKALHRWFYLNDTHQWTTDLPINRGAQVLYQFPGEPWPPIPEN